MNFFSAHYEKVILLSFLILFIVLLLLQVNFMQNVQNQKIDAIMSKVEPPTDQQLVDYKKPEYNLNNVFKSTAVWNKTVASGINPKTELLSCFELSVCPFCGDLIRSSYFPTAKSSASRKCPVCGEELVLKQKRSEKPIVKPGEQVAQNADMNNNSVPDDWERKYNVYSTSGNEVDLDHDNDNFTTWEEFKLGTNPRNAKSHPEYINCISFVKLNVNVFVNLRFRGVYSHEGTDVNKWKLRMEHQRITDRRRRLSSELSVGSRFRHGRDTFEILSCHADDINEPGDGTYVMIRRVGTKEKIRCDYLKPVYDPIQIAVFRNSHPEGEFTCKIGGTFALGNSAQGINRYKVLSVSNTKDSAVVQNIANKKRYTIRTVQALKQVPLRSGSAGGNMVTAPAANEEFKPLQLDDIDSGRSSRRRRGGRR